MSETAIRALIERWQQGVANLYAANEEESLPLTRTIRYIRAEEIERLIGELRDALSAPSPVPAGTEDGET
jgi:hypothetical protein